MFRVKVTVGVAILCGVAASNSSATTACGMDSLGKGMDSFLYSASPYLAETPLRNRIMELTYQDHCMYDNLEIPDCACVTYTTLNDIRLMDTAVEIINAEEFYESLSVNLQVEAEVGSFWSSKTSRGSADFQESVQYLSHGDTEITEQRGNAYLAEGECRLEEASYGRMAYTMEFLNDLQDLVHEKSVYPKGISFVKRYGTGILTKVTSGASYGHRSYTDKQGMAEYGEVYADREGGISDSGLFHTVSETDQEAFESDAGILFDSKVSTDMAWCHGACPPSQSSEGDWLQPIQDGGCVVARSSIVMLPDMLSEVRAPGYEDDTVYSQLIDYVRRSISAYCIITGACEMDPYDPTPADVPETSIEYQLHGTGSQAVYMTGTENSVCFLTALYRHTYTDVSRCDIIKEGSSWKLTLTNGYDNTKCYARCFTSSDGQISASSQEITQLRYNYDMYDATYLALFSKPGCRDAGRIAGLVTFDDSDNSAVESERLGMQTCEIFQNSANDPGYWSLYSHAFTECTMNCYAHTFGDNSVQFYEAYNDNPDETTTVKVVMAEEGKGVCWLVGVRRLPNIGIRGCHVTLEGGFWSVNAYREANSDGGDKKRHLTCRAVCLEP